MTSSLNILECASQDVSSMELDNNEWVCIDLTADSGACDSVMPRSGPCENIKIYPSMQSERGWQYEVASAQTLPCLRERRLEAWTEGAESAKAMVIQIAHVHKPLSRCADMESESRFGKDYGALVDVETGKITRLHRQGNLYMLRVWVTSAMSPCSPFGGPR